MVAYWVLSFRECVQVSSQLSRARIYCVDDIFGGEGQDAFEFMYISIRYWARNALLLRMIVRTGLHVRMCRHKTSDLDLHLRMNVVAPSLFQIGVLFPQQPSRHFPSSTFSLICGAFIPNLRPTHKRQGLSAVKTSKLVEVLTITAYREGS
jgi:hypothetical protein